MRKRRREPRADEARREGLTGAKAFRPPWRDETQIRTDETFAARTRNISNIDAGQPLVLKEVP